MSPFTAEQSFFCIVVLGKTMSQQRIRAPYALSILALSVAVGGCTSGQTASTPGILPQTDSQASVSPASLATAAAQASSQTNSASLNSVGRAGKLSLHAAAAVVPPLFSDDFNAGVSKLWLVTRGNWTACTAPGTTLNTYCSATDSQGSAMSSSAYVAGSQKWTDYTVSATVRLENVNPSGYDRLGVDIVSRAQDSSHYYALSLARENDRTFHWELTRTSDSGVTSLARGAYTLSNDSTYYVTLSTIGSTIAAAISTDGVNFAPLGQVTDTTYPAGQIGIRTWGGMKAFFESMSASSGSATPPPSPVASASPTAVPSGGPSAKPSASPSANPSPNPSANPSAGPSPKPTLSPVPVPSGSPIAGLSSERAQQADAFVDSIAVNTHFNYGGVYKSLWPISSKMLLASGIRHIRDYTGGKSTYLYQQGGIDLVAQYNTDVTAATITSEIQNNPNLIAMEPQNEYDARAKKDPQWVAHISAEQKLMYATIHGNPALARQTTVLGPSLASSRTAVTLGDLSPYMDAGNAHAGTCDYFPANTTSNDDVMAKLARMRAVDGNRPIWVTELASTNDAASTGCQLSDSIGAKYEPRMFAYLWNMGVPREYIYELQDDGSGSTFSNQGLIDINGAAKPEYTAMKSMIALLSDKGSTFGPSVLSYKLSGNTANVRHTLLQKRDGSYWLLLWLSVSSWDHAAKKAITVAPQSVTMGLMPSLTSVTSYTYDGNWNLRTASIPLASHAATISVTDQITFVKLH